MNTAIAPMYQWTTRGWVKSERQVFKLPNRIYRAAKRGDHRQVRRRQKLLLRSRAANLLAVRTVTQANQGKQTPGVEGVANLTPQERRALVKHLPLEGNASPVRRVYIPKPGTTEPRPVGIPTMAARATQAVVKHGLEPAGEAPCEPHSDGLRPGRNTWEALGALDVQINQRPTGVLDADIAPGFARIHHDALLRKLDAPPPLSRQIIAWLTVGLLDQGAWCPPEAGPPQGGPASPWFANVALHGREEAITRAFPGRGSPAGVRDAEELIV